MAAVAWGSGAILGMTKENDEICRVFLVTFLLVGDGDGRSTTGVLFLKSDESKFQNWGIPQP